MSLHGSMRKQPLAKRIMGYMKRVTTAIGAVALVATTLIVTPAVSASAAPPSASSTCTTLSVGLSGYSASVSATNATYKTTYQRYSWTGNPSQGDPSASSPLADPSNWQANTTNYNETDPVGVPFDTSNGNGNASWFYWTSDQVLDQPATSARTNIYSVSINGTPVDSGDFSESFAKDYAFSDSTVANSWSVTVTPHDGTAETTTGTSSPCVAAVVYATASVSTVPATCDSGEILVYGDITNADWNTSSTPDRTEGPLAEYTVIADADTGHPFSDESTSMPFTGSLAGPLTDGCTTTPPVDQCPSDFKNDSMWEVTWGYGFTDRNGGAPIFNMQSNGGLTGINGGPVPSYMGDPATSTWHWLYINKPATDKVTTYQFADGSQRSVTVTADESGCPSIVWAFTPPPPPAVPTVTFDAIATCGSLTLEVTTANMLTNRDYYYGLKAEDENGTVLGSVVQKNDGTNSKTITFAEDSHSGIANVKVYVHAATEWNFVPNELNYQSTYPVFGDKFIAVEVNTDCAPPPPTVNVCSSTGNGGVSTNVNPNGWTFSETRLAGANTYVTGGLEVETTPSAGGNAQSKAAGYHTASNIPFADIGNVSMDYTYVSGVRPSMQIGFDKDGNGTWDGYLVYEPDSYGIGQWWSSKDFGVGAGGGYASMGTLDEYLQANPDATAVNFGYSLGSGVLGKSVIHSITFGCAIYTFDHENIPTSADVVFVDHTCSAVGTITLTGENGTWTIVNDHDTVAGPAGTVITGVPSGTYDARLDGSDPSSAPDYGGATFTFVPNAGYSATGQTEWTHHATKPDCDVTASATAVMPVCTGVDQSSVGSVTLTGEHVTWNIVAENTTAAGPGGTLITGVPSGTYDQRLDGENPLSAPYYGEVTFTPVADAGYTLTDATPVTFDIVEPDCSKAVTVAPKQDTLAYTGSEGSSSGIWWALGFIGLGIIAIVRSRRRRAFN